MAESHIPDDILQAVAVNNVKTIGEGPASYHNIGLGNAASYQQAMNVLTNAVAARSAAFILDTQISDAVAQQKLASGNDLAQNFGQLMAAAAMASQQQKAAVLTPPTTNP